MYMLIYRSETDPAHKCADRDIWWSEGKLLIKLHSYSCDVHNPVSKITMTSLKYSMRVIVHVVKLVSE